LLEAAVPVAPLAGAAFAGAFVEVPLAGTLAEGVARAGVFGVFMSAASGAGQSKGEDEYVETYVQGPPLDGQ
jgi:hypothetical protein